MDLTLQQIDSTLKRIDRNGDNGCWNWTGVLRKSGYGEMSISGKTRLAHRIVYSIFKGHLTPGKILRHLCDNPRCCNPDHLLEGDHYDNVHDMMERGGGRYKGRYLTAEKVREILADYGHETVGVIAKRYGIGETTVRGIVQGKRWAKTHRDACLDKLINLDMSQLSYG
jgi:hypothetical protein